MKYLLDTNAVIYLLGGRLRQPLPQGYYGVSVITEIEVLSFPGLGSNEEQTVRQFLAEVERHPLADAVRDRTIALRRQFKLKLPDAVIAATAIEAGAVLVTNDRQLQGVPGLGTLVLELN